jgi:hypothetical protein
LRAADLKSGQGHTLVVLGLQDLPIGLVLLLAKSSWGMDRNHLRSLAHTHILRDGENWGPRSQSGRNALASHGLLSR